MSGGFGCLCSPGVGACLTFNVEGAGPAICKSCGPGIFASCVPRLDGSKGGFSTKVQVDDALVSSCIFGISLFPGNLGRRSVGIGLFITYGSPTMSGRTPVIQT